MTHDIQIIIFEIVQYTSRLNYFKILKITLKV